MTKETLKIILFTAAVAYMALAGYLLSGSLSTCCQMSLNIVIAIPAAGLMIVVTAFVGGTVRKKLSRGQR